MAGPNDGDEGSRAASALVEVDLRGAERAGPEAAAEANRIRERVKAAWARLVAARGAEGVTASRDGRSISRVLVEKGRVLGVEAGAQDGQGVVTFSSTRFIAGKARQITLSSSRQ